MNAVADLLLKEVTSSDQALLEQIEVTYTDSFPVEERRDFHLVKQIIDGDNRFRIKALMRNNQYVGFITAWTFDDFVYIEHFAIDSSARNGGIGAGALQCFMDAAALPVVLEVEAPFDEMSKRRIGFYQRLGFTLDHQTYHQPPYRENGEWLPMHLMSRGEIDMQHSFEDVKRHLYTHVYRVKPD